MAAMLAIGAGPTAIARAQVAVGATPAGTVLSNTANLTIGVNPDDAAIASNPVRTIVAEQLDVALRTTTPTLTAPQGPSAIAFALTNVGNGREAFVLNALITDADAAILGFAVDRDGDGRFDPAIDLPIALNDAIPALAAGESVQLLVLLQGNGVGSSGTLTVQAVAKTGLGVPGAVFAGLGDGGGDAVVGSTGAAAVLTFTLTVAGQPGEQAISVVKSQRVSGAGGSSEPVRGATITYSIVTSFGATGIAPAARIVDRIPTGTVYIPGSLRLDGAVLSDVADGDAGGFDGASIAVSLGDVAAPAVHTAEFQVTIQ
jgi:uncharacterized repeat protein (TIGR01451 family)